MIELSIPEATPTLNSFVHAHWTKYRAARKHWSLLVMVAKSQAKQTLLEPLARASVRVERHGKYTLDEDNLVGGCKVLIDALKDNGLIVDDSPEHLSLTVEQRPKSKIPRTIVTLASLPTIAKPRSAS